MWEKELGGSRRTKRVECRCFSGKREEWKCKRTDYSHGSRGDHEGPGYSAHARRPWERALTFRQCPLFLFRSIRPALHSVSSLLLSRPYHDSPPSFDTYSARPLAPGPNSSVSVPREASGRGSPITAERARSKAPRARSYSFRGAQYLGDR